MTDKYIVIMTVFQLHFISEASSYKTGARDKKVLKPSNS